LFYHFVEFFFSIGLIINALLFVIQAIRLFKKKASEGISLLTFTGFNLIQFFTICHAYFVEDYKLMVGYILSFCACAVVTILTIYYRLKNKKDGE
jgi:MtN3 and saliva related transmembrane protein